MIVEDDPNILFSLKVMFETEGYEVITVKNGLQCLAELEEGFQGVIILDLVMPVMDGVETIKNMVIDGFIEDNIIIVLTVKSIQGEEFDEIYPYIYEYITKPYDINELLNVVKDTIKEMPKKIHGKKGNKIVSL
jgi:DNA-binding response OmpR family regulator